MNTDIKQLLQNNVHFHPKLVYQNKNIPEIQKKFLSNMPSIIPFNGYSYHSALLLFDWDHRLPSQKIYARLYCFYNSNTQKLALNEYQSRFEKIDKLRDFPEFNTVDFSKITSDETYIFTLNLKGELRHVDFDALWKKDFLKSELRKITKIIIKSPIYKEINKTKQNACGPLRILSWMPPCKTYLDKWTIDVRYISYCEKNSVWGKILYVDLQNECIVKTDNFNMRI